jgi:hypothetical protein
MTYPAAQISLFAERAATDDWESLVPDVERAVRAILMAQPDVAWWQVRLALYQIGKVGTEEIRGAGTFSKRCGLVPLLDEDGNVMTSRPSELYNSIFPKSHANRHSRYRYPTTLAERQRKVNR